MGCEVSNFHKVRQPTGGKTRSGETAREGQADSGGHWQARKRTGGEVLADDKGKGSRHSARRRHGQSAARIGKGPRGHRSRGAGGEPRPPRFDSRRASAGGNGGGERERRRPDNRAGELWEAKREGSGSGRETPARGRPGRPGGGQQASRPRRHLLPTRPPPCTAAGSSGAEPGHEQGRPARASASASTQAVAVGEAAAERAGGAEPGQPR